MLLAKDIIGRSESRLQVELHDGRTPVLNRKFVYGTREHPEGVVVLAPGWYVGKTLGLPVYSPPPTEPPPVVDELLCLAPWPMHTRTTPWAHQRAAYDRVAGLRAACLNMDMGTGKSKVVLDLAGSRYASKMVRKLLVVAPVNLKENWAEQVALHCPMDTVERGMLYTFGERTTSTDPALLRWIRDERYGIAICGLESLSVEKYGGRAYHAALRIVRECRTMLAVDECHKIKGGDANRTVNTLSLAKWCPYRMIVTGTQIVNTLGDLFWPYWSLDPRIIGYQRESEFERHHVITEPIEGTGRRKVVMYVGVEQVAARIAPYTVQCTKADALDLPAKRFSSRTTWLTEAQHEAYAQAKQELLGEEGEKDAFTEFEILRLFTALQQITSGYWNHITYTRNPVTRELDRHAEMRQLVPWEQNPKVKALLDTVEACAPAQVVVWCKHRPEVADVVAALRGTYGQDQVAQLHGGIRQADRAVELERFRTGAARFFVSLPQAGGEGLNGLQVAHQCIYYSNSFKYGERVQSEDRLHRPGQTNRVTYTDLWTDTGMDRIICRCLEKKEDLDEWVKRALAESTRKLLEEL